MRVALSWGHDACGAWRSRGAGGGAALSTPAGSVGVCSCLLECCVFPEYLPRVSACNSCSRSPFL